MVSVFVRYKVTINENESFADYASGIRRLDCSKLAINWKNYNDVKSSRNVFDVVLFLLSSLVTRPNFMSISSLVLELWQFSFIRDWPETLKSKLPSSVFCPISGDWSELEIPSFTQLNLMRCYWMRQNVRVTAFTFSELLRESQQPLRGNIPCPPPLYPTLPYHAPSYLMLSHPDDCVHHGLIIAKLETYGIGENKTHIKLFFPKTTKGKSWLVLQRMVRDYPWDSTEIYTRANPFQCFYQWLASFH